MIFRETEIPGVRLVELESRSDERGSFTRTWCARELAGAGLVAEVAQCNSATSRRLGTLRGLHYQLDPHAEAKVVRCVRGALYDVVVDARPDSPTYLAWLGAELRAGDGRMVYVPELCAHGYLTLEDDTEVAYVTSAFYAPESERGIHYADPAVAIDWPAPVEIVSERDRAWPFVTGGRAA
jgi:dTDP-4-dehydrorhamnose 3,5-epimerase